MGRSAAAEVKPDTGLAGIRERYNRFIARHEVAWELTMAALAVAFVVVGFAGDDATGATGVRLRTAEAVITAVFVLEFGSRFIAAWDRRRYLREHWIDIVALIPAIREVRILRLLRFLRLFRVVASIYRALGIPLFHRIGWHLQRVAQHFDPRTTLVLGGTLGALVLVAALLVTWIEGPVTFQQFGEAIYWAINTLLGSGDPGFVNTFSGRFISGVLIVASLTFLAVITGLVIGFIIDVVLKEGQGLGVAGLTGHVVVCGWNDTAREVLEELHEDKHQVVVLADLESPPTGSRAHFVRGDPSVEEDLERAGIREAASAIVFPEHPGEDADMRSILIVMAVKHLAPDVRTVVEAASPKNIPHLKRAHADEVIATPKFVAHLLARSSVHAGLVDLVMDMVTGGEGSELYRIPIPSDFADATAGEAGPALRNGHRAVLLAVIRDGRNVVNPPADFLLQHGDELLILAESVDSLADSYGEPDVG